MPSSPPGNGKAPRGGLSVWMSDSLFAPEALWALLHHPIPIAVARRPRGKTEYNLMELVDAARQSQEDNKKMSTAAHFVDETCIVPRDSKRWDVRLKPLWVERMRSVNVAFADMCRMVENVCQNDIRCANATVDWHVQMVYPGSNDQPLHMDDTEDDRGARCYYTYIVPLVDNPRAGGTHFPKLNNTFSTYGGAVLFDGTVEHAGMGNRSQQVRYFIYAAIYTGTDENCDPKPK